jgi:tetratricopeptide (TPR) repeat protein
LIAEGRLLASARRHQEAIERLEQIVDRYPTTLEALEALGQIASSYGAERRNGEAVGYLQHVARAFLGSELSAKAEFLTFRHLVRMPDVDYNDLLGKIDAFITTYPESEQAPYAMLRKGRVYLNRLADSEAAKTIFQETIVAYPDRPEIQRLAETYYRTALEQLGETDVSTAVPLSAIRAQERAVSKLLVAPNPFNPATTLTFSLTEPQRVELAIYNVLGQVIRVLSSRTLPAGEHRVTWDGKDALGNDVGTGIYVASLRAGATALAVKIALLR